MKVKWYLIILTIFGVILLVAFLKSETFLISSVNIDKGEAGCVSEDQLIKEADLLGKSILLVDEKNMINLLKKYPCVKDFKVERKYPKNLVVYLFGRTPLARVAGYQKLATFDQIKEATASSQSALLDWSMPAATAPFLLVDEEGVVFSQTISTASAIIHLPGNIFLGTEFDRGLFKKIATVFKKIDEFGLILEGVSLKIENGYLLIKSKQQIVFSLEKDLLKQLASLQLILQKAKIEGKVLETIDVRFDKPVVRYGKQV